MTTGESERENFVKGGWDECVVDWRGLHGGVGQGARTEDLRSKKVIRQSPGQDKGGLKGEPVEQDTETDSKTFDIFVSKDCGRIRVLRSDLKVNGPIEDLQTIGLSCGLGWEKICCRVCDCYNYFVK